MTDPHICGCAQTVGVRKDDDESAMEKLSAEHEENNADPEEIPDPEEIGEEIEVCVPAARLLIRVLCARRGACGFRG